MPTVDNLDIEISASVSKANASLDLLVKRLGKVSASLSGVNTRGIATMASGVNKLANAMNNFSNNTNTAVFTRLTRNLNSLGNIDQRAIANASKSLGKIAGAMKVFNNINVSDNARQLGELAKGISQLGYSSATKAINNIPQLATAMRNLMQTLSTAPRVSQNIIDMTNALAKLARTGASSGRAANSLSKSLSLYSKSTIGAKRNSLSLAGAIGKVYATYWLLFRAFGKIREAIDISSGLQEVQNVIDVTFGNFKQKVEDLAKVSITDFGMSELTAKQIAGRFQAMGTAMGIAQGKMSDMSIELTKLSADMASFYNVAQEDVARSLQSVFTGEAEPLRKYGVDLTQATLKTFALSQGLDSNVEAMTQAEKSMLRYQYVMHATGAAQGDFARTSNNWANQIRILKGNFQELAGIIGTSFINALKPLVQALNSAMRAIINFAKVVSNSLGKIFGWQYEETGGGVTADMESASEYAEDLASGTGEAANNAKKLKQQLQGIDELNVLTTPSDTGGSGGSGGGGGGTATESGDVGQWTKTDGLLKDYESQLDTLYKLGEEIGNKLKDAMGKIPWDDIYKEASGFGSGLASFLNGLFSENDKGETVFGAVGKTIAGALRTAINSALSFGEELDWKQLGSSIADFFNNFAKEMNRINPNTGLTGWQEFAETLNEFVDGLKETISTAIKDIDVKEMIKSLFDFADGLELDTIVLILGAFAWKYKGAEMALSAIGSLLAKDFAVGIGTLSTSVGVALGLSVTTAILSFKIGEKLYEEVPTVQQIADSVAEWILGDGEEIAIARTISIALGGLAIGLTASLITKIPTLISNAILGAYPNGISLANTPIGKAGIKIAGLMLAIESVKLTYDNVTGDETSIGDILGSGIMAGIGTLLLTGNATLALAIGVTVSSFNIGGFIYENNDTVANMADSLVELVAGLFDGNYSLNDYIQGGIEMGIDLSVKLLNLLLPDGSEIDANTISENWLPKYLASYLFGDETEKNNAVNFFANIGIKVAETAETFYTNHIKPLIDGIKEKSIELKANLTGIKQKTIDNIRKAWNKLLKVKKSLSLKAILTGGLSSAIQKVKDMWDELKGEKKLSLSAVFNDTFSGNLKRIWNSLANSINEMIDKIPYVGTKIPDVPTFKGYANGGFPEDGWFRASRGEIMGKFDNGQSVVANNMQITEGISSAVQRGNQQLVAYLQQEVNELRQQNEYLRTIASKEFGITEKQIGQASQRFARDYSNRTGKPAFI